MNKIRFVGLDVHADTIAIAVAEPSGEVRCFGVIVNRPVGVPDAAHEALRDLVRAREAAKREQLRARHRLGKFLLRSGWQRPEHLKIAWSKPHLRWIRTKIHFAQPTQEAALGLQWPGSQ